MACEAEHSAGSASALWRSHRGLVGLVSSARRCTASLRFPGCMEVILRKTRNTGLCKSEPSCGLFLSMKPPALGSQRCWVSRQSHIVLPPIPPPRHTLPLSTFIRTGPCSPGMFARLVLLSYFCGGVGKQGTERLRGLPEITQDGNLC